MTDQNEPDNRPFHRTHNQQDVRVADATDLNWVDRFMPLWSRPYLRLSRADRPAGTWLLLIPCWQSLALAIAATGWQWADIWFFVAFGLGAFLMRGAGCTWNDITDREIDASVERTRSRPLPAGQVTVKGAVAWMIVQALISFAILLSFNSFSIWVGIAALVPVAIYPFMKRVTWWPQIFLGIAFNWGALMGWAVHTGGIGPEAVILYLGGIAWTLHYDTIYAHQDTEDDALIGVKSTARLFGDDTVRWLGWFVAVAIVAAGLAATIALSGLSLIIAMVGVAIYGGHMGRQLIVLDINDTDKCMRLFGQNRDTGLILLAGFLIAGLV